MMQLPPIFRNGCRGAVSLTYDDALDAHLDAAIPDLEAAELRGTFYIPTRQNNAWQARPDEWKAAHARGHEIANHTQYHPCSGRHPWVKPNFTLEAYSLARMESELLGASADLTSVLGTGRTSFAYPCGEWTVGPDETSYRPMVDRLFPAARGVATKKQLVDPFDCDFSYVPAWVLNEKTRADDVIGFIDDAIEQGRWAVVILHGVGGGHSINVARETHRALCRHLAIHRDQIWCDTFLNVAQHIRGSTTRPAPR
jgi:peptidoglycan/xylan/chitin deacetylase (PgdA/CDA1 family)